MAISKNPNLKGIRGTIENLIVVRQYGDKTVLSKFPDMTKIVPSEDQKRQRSKFARAQKYATELLKNSEIKAFYKEKCEGRQRPHNLLISDLFNGTRQLPDGYE